MSNKKKLLKKMGATFPYAAAQSYLNKLKEVYASKYPNLGEAIENMTPEQFSAWVKEIVPLVKGYAIDTARKNKGTPYEKQLMSAADDFEKAWPHTWTRDQFLKALNRQPTETGKFDKQGKPIMAPAHIGRLTDDDIMYLRGAGLDEDEIPMLADKFRQEYQDSVIAAAEKERPKLEAKERQKVKQEAENDWMYKLKKMLSPDVYAAMMHDIETGTDSGASNWLEWLLKHPRDIGVDVARELVTAMSIYAGATTGNPAVTAALVTAAGITGDAASDWYSVKDNLGSNAAAGVAAATAPALVDKFLGLFRGIPDATIVRALRDVMKSTKRGMTDAVSAEVGTVKQNLADAANVVKQAAKRGTAFGAYDAEKAVSDMMAALERAPNYIAGEKLGRADVSKMLKTITGRRKLQKLLAPMDEKGFIKTQDKLKTLSKNLENEEVLNDAIALEQQLKKQAAFYPNLTNEWRSKFNPATRSEAVKYNLFKKGGEVVNAFGGYFEPLMENNGIGISSLYSSGLMGQDLGLKRSLNSRIKHYGVEDWEAGLNTKDPLYQEWLAKYHPELLEEQ